MFVAAAILGAAFAGTAERQPAPHEADRVHPASAADGRLATSAARQTGCSVEARYACPSAALVAGR
jgi:hypothetical protein